MRSAMALTIIAVTVLLLVGGSGRDTETASAWSSFDLVQDAHKKLASMTLDWFANNGWSFEGHNVRTRTGPFGLTNPWDEVTDGASTEVDCSWDTCETPGGIDDTYHGAGKYQEKLWEARPDYREEFCEAAHGTTECDFDPLMGAEERAAYWTSRARQCVEDARDEGKVQPSDYSECQRYAGYAIHYAQDAVSPPHVDPWAKGFWWLVSPAPHTCLEWNDETALTQHEDEIDIDREHIIILDEELNIGLPTLKATIVGLADETEADWPDPDPPSVSAWKEWDPFSGEPRDFWNYDSTYCSTRVLEDERVVSALNRAALLTKSILIYVFGFTPPQLDLAFVVDTTSSMGNDIAAAKSAATEIVNSVMDSVPDSRIALVDFRDFPVSPYGGGGDYDYHDALPFTSDRTAAVNAINGLTLGWGADTPEDDYCALMHTINGHTCRGSGVGSGIGDWRNIPSKFIILMTDAPPHDPEPFTGFTWSDVAEAARNADPITIEVVAIGGVDSRLAALAAETGGDVFTAPTADDVVAAIMEAIETILDSPVADAGGPYEGTVGAPITFDGSGSYDPDGTIVSYEWDWDSDGTYDETTASPSAEHSYIAPYDGLLTLRVTDNDGLTGIDTASVTVGGNLPPELTVPGEQHVQYSDWLGFTVSASDPDDPPESLSFSATGLCDGLSLVDNGDGTASVEGNVQSPAGTCNAEITVTDPDGLTDTATVPVVVAKEDAGVEYTGDTMVRVGSPVTLRAHVYELPEIAIWPGPLPGDITKAAVFFDVTAGIGGGMTSYGPAPVSASGEAAWTFPTGLPSNVYSVDVRMDPANGYYRADPAVTAALVVYDPSAGFTTGGGWVADGGEHGNFGFSVKYLKSGTIQGQALYVYRWGDVVTRVKSNAMRWLVISGSTAVFRGKATVNDVGNHTFEIRIVDNGQPGSADTFAIKIWRPNGTLLHEVPAATLGGGNLIVPQPNRR